MKFIALILLTSLLTGCALKTDYVDIEYKPYFTPQRIVETGNVEVAISVNDLRDKENVGDKVWESFNIMANNDLSETFKNAIIWELQQRGFIIGQNGYDLNIEIYKLYNHFAQGGFTADANSETVLNVTLRNREGIIAYSKTIIGYGDEKPCFNLSGKNASLALERSLSQAVQKLMEDPNFIQALTNH